MIGSNVLNYRIEKLLGTGGMGSVYYATNINIDHKVAIKVLNKNLSDSTIVKNWFKNEANLLCQLDHPNIVKFLNFVENEDGIFLIMEYVDGVSLEDFITKKNGLIVEERVYELFDQILNAFSYAHKRGIVHRDIKPANIILTAGDEGEFVVKILDFGIAGFTTSINEDKSWIVGTPSYMSPEQVNGEDIDQRSDIYSLGVLLHQMLTGRTPYDATTLSEVIIKEKVLKEPLPRMKEYYAYVSEKLQRIVDKAVEKDKKNRYQSCTEFSRAMKKALKPEPTSKKIKIISAALVFILLGIGAGLWDYNRTKTYYYKDYVEQWGIPQGIGKLSGGDVSHSNRHYKFEYKKYKLQRVSHVNSLDKIISDGESERYERPLDMLLFYGDNGKISYARILDHNGKVLYKKSYNEKLTTAIFQYDDQYSTEKTLSAQTVGYVKSFDENTDEKGKISRWLLEYDKNGYVSKVQYAGFQNVLVGDKHGIFGRSYVRDDKGRVLEEHYLGSDGTPKATKWGMGIKKFYYDKEDNWVRSEYLTIDQKASYDDADGIAVYTLEYDKYGNVILALHCESNGELMLPKKHHISGVAYTYDNKGFITQRMFLGLDKKPCFVQNAGFAGYRTECDKNGFFSKQTYLDPNGTICTASNGYAVQTFLNDEKGNQLESWTFDEKNKLVETTEGYAGYKAQYDSLGNIVKFIAYGPDKKPCIKKDATAGYQVEYTELGKVSKITNLGTDMKPCKDNDGVAIWTAEYDKRGNRTKLSFYDATGEKLQLSNEGVAGWRSVYDENGNETERSFFNIQNKPCLVNGGYAKWIAKYDDRGNKTECTYYDVAGKPIITKEGYASEKYKYDERGNVLEKIFTDTNGNNAPGRLICRYKYDKFDNETEMTVFDKNNKPDINSNNWHKRTQKYDERNQIIETQYYGTDGKLTTFGTDKYAIEQHLYDVKGNPIETRYFNTSNRPCVCKEGWSISTRKFDSMNRVIKQSFFDAERKPTDPKIMVPEGFVKYDKWGNMIYLAAGDGKGNLIINPNTGWAISEKEFDIKGNEIWVTYYDPQKKVIEPKGIGYAKSVSQYDKRGNCIEQKLYDKDGNLRKGKHAIIKNKYDEFNRLLETSYYNANNKPCDGDNSWYKEVYSMYVGTQAQYFKLYKTDGSLLATFKYMNNQWVIQSNKTDVTKQVLPSSGGHESLASVIEAERRECPKQLADGIELTTAYMQSGVGVFVFRLVEVSMYNLSDSDKDSYISNFRQYKETILKDLGKGSRVIFIVNDKANRKLFTV